ncbi:MAG TPA: chemotaxis protein CheB [Pirellulales bacterium]|nr:chemotaxis protein CheB [Pirellulales bacterium]
MSTVVPVRAVVIGASAGAIEALSVVFSKLPRHYALPILVVVHVPPDRHGAIPALFAAKCLLSVREADDKEPIEPGTIYFAPPDYHLMVDVSHSIALSSEEPVLFSRPSIDVLFETAADVYGSDLVGVILTGANSDGARGLKRIADAGGVALVQRPDQAAASAMPQAALDSCPQARAMSLDEIASYLRNLGTTG